VRNLRLHWRPDQGWLIDCPAAPTPAQMGYVRGILRSPRGIDHILHVGGVATEHRTAALEDALAGRVTANVLGPRMNGTGDLKLFEAPKPRERIYVGT
jgi:hypothetical protein